MPLKAAIVSPNKNAYSETFIQAHKNLLNAEVAYFFGGGLPSQLEGKGSLTGNSRSERIVHRLTHKLKSNTSKAPSLREYVFSKTLTKIRPHVVLAEYGPTGVKILPVCKSLNIPLVVHFHGYDASRTDVLEKNRQAYKELFDYASSIIAVSKPMSEKLIKAGCPKEKLILNPYGPSDEFFAVKPSYSENSFVAIGRFVDKKAPYYTILAFKEVVKQFPDSKLYMAGDGVLKNTCENLAKHFGISKNIDFLGVITPEEYQDLLKKVKAFVQHSITAANGDMEGTPVAVLEASAAGLPVVATRHAGIPEVIVEGETGYLVDEHDVGLMAEHMIRILKEKDLAKELGKRGKSRIKDLYSMDRHISELNKVLERAANHERT